MLGWKHLDFLAFIQSTPWRNPSNCAFEFEITEATAEKAVFKFHECQWYNRMKELGISDDLCTAACPAYWNGLAKSFNPKLNASLAKAMPLGDPFCEHVQELQK
jgi:hypothetical protein